ncbi:MAG: hypothetical protein IT518_08980 [Burkholderiales bacterium]|nr:hypothetical protein [Burkholderiales bacterium]
MNTESDFQIITDAAMDFLAMPVGIPNSWRALTPEQARGLQKMLGTRADFREAALTRGNAVSEANIWLGGKAGGHDLPAEDVSRMARGLGPTAVQEAE